MDKSIKDWMVGLPPIAARESFSGAGKILAMVDRSRFRPRWSGQAISEIPAHGLAQVIWLKILEIFRGFAQFFRLIQSIPDSLDQ